MAIHRRKANLGNLGEEFLDKDPQQESGRDYELETLDAGMDARDADDPSLLSLPNQYSDDILLSTDNQRAGPLSTEFLSPAPSQELYADEEPGGMFGSSADELMGSPSPDAQDLGDASPETSGLMGSDRELDGVETVELMSGEKTLVSTGLEDHLATDLPSGGTYGDAGPVVDPDTGELSDYDDSKASAAS